MQDEQIVALYWDRKEEFLYPIGMSLITTPGGTAYGNRKSC